MKSISIARSIDCFHLLQLASSDLSGQSGSLSHLQCGAMQLVWLNLYSEHVNSPESQSGAAEIQREAERELENLEASYCIQEYTQ